MAGTEGKAAAGGDGGGGGDGSGGGGLGGGLGGSDGEPGGGTGAEEKVSSLGEASDPMVALVAKTLAESL